MDGVDRDCFIFSRAVAFTNEGIKEHISSLYIHHAEANTIHPLLQWETTRRKVLSSMLQTRSCWSVLYSGISVEAEKDSGYSSVLVV